MTIPVLICAMLGAAPRPIGFEEAIRLGGDSAVAVVLSVSRAREADARLGAMTAKLQPRVDLVASQTERSYNYLTGGIDRPGIAPRIPFYSIQEAKVRATAPLFAMDVWDQRSEAKASAGAVSRRAGVVVDASRLQAGLAWIELARAQALEADRRRALELAGELVKLTDDQHRAGGATGLDLVRARGQEKISRRALEAAAMARIQAAGTLADLLGLPTTDSVFTAAPLPMDEDPVPASPTDGEDVRVAAAKAEVDAARSAQAGGSHAWFPTVGLAAEYGLSGRHLDEDGEWVGSLGVVASWNVWDGGAKRSASAQTEERLLQARRSLAQADKEAQRSRTQALALFETSRSALRDAREACELSDSELVLSRERFVGGASGNLEVVQAQASRTQAHAAWIEAAAAHQAALVRLRSAYGMWTRKEENGK